MPGSATCFVSRALARLLLLGGDAVVGELEDRAGLHRFPDVLGVDADQLCGGWRVVSEGDQADGGVLVDLAPPHPVARPLFTRLGLTEAVAETLVVGGLLSWFRIAKGLEHHARQKRGEKKHATQELVHDTLLELLLEIFLAEETSLFPVCPLAGHANGDLFVEQLLAVLSGFQLHGNGQQDGQCDEFGQDVKSCDSKPDCVFRSHLTLTCAYIITFII